MKTIEISVANWRKINTIRKKHNLRNNSQVIDMMFQTLEDAGYDVLTKQE